MGNLIKDFWTYRYKEKNYFGIIEVVAGEDLAQKRHEKKYETHIEKALNYTMKHDILSHMSIQTYCKWLKDRPGREEKEQKYYPFVLEFESKKDTVYNDAVCEAAVYVNYLVKELDVNKDDILVMINNSRSIYVYVNPKTYALKPSKDLHKIYFEMYKKMKAELGFKCVDESIVTSSYKIMKTPNTYYKGGYFAWITSEELMQLLTGVKTKAELTSAKRSLNKDIPGQISLKMSRLYNAAVKKINTKTYGANESSEDETFSYCGGKCVKYLLQHIIEKGYRNYGLVSVGIYLKSLGYSKEEVIANLKELAKSWNHDEGVRNIESKVNTIFRKNYRFSCKYAKAVYADLGIESHCDKCPYNKRKAAAGDAVAIDAAIINELWAKNASTRHYLLYIELVKKNLLNREFNAKDNNINERTLRELCSLCSLERKSTKKQAYISYKPSKKLYKLPIAFINNSIKELGDYIKHYLRLFVKGYKALDKYILIRMNKETLMDLLGYSDMSAVYKFLKKLKSIGLIKESKNSVYSLYYETYKVIDINTLLPKEKEAITVTQEEFEAAVVGEQMIFKDIDNMPNLFFKPGSISSIIRKKIARGSPGNSG